jgi:hypothetical protein
MFERLKHLTDEFRSHLPGTKQAPAQEGLTDQGLAELRAAVQERFPKLPTWSEIKYSDQSLAPVHLVPLPPKPPEGVAHEIENLTMAMLSDGVLHSHVQLHSFYEELQPHIWVATLAPGSHRPIGMLIFHKELRAGNDTGGVAGQWWLSFAWVRPCDRRKGLFRNSLACMRKWHPDFQVHAPTPELRKALRDCPDCICDPLVSWA